MNNTRRAMAIRTERGDYEKYFKGQGIDIGAGADPLSTPFGQVRAWDRKDGDAQKLPGISAASLDFVYSSHCLEHLVDVEAALRRWVEVLKPGGWLYVAVPDFALYERMRWPSIYNRDHKHTFSLTLHREKVKRTNHYDVGADVGPLLRGFGAPLIEVHLEDDGYDYNLGPVDQTLGAKALAQLVFVARRG